MLTQNELKVLAMVKGVPLGGDETTSATEDDFVAARSLVSKGLLILKRAEDNTLVVTLTSRGDAVWLT
jgi:hypothetical protein